MFILHKGNNCTQRSLLNLNEQANYAALFFLPTAFSAVTKLHTKTRAFPQGAGFICSNLCALLRWNLEDVGLQVALPFPQGRAWGIVVSFALSLQVCSTSPWPFQRLKTAKQTTAKQTTAKPALLLAGFVQTISAALCPTTELPLPALPCSHPAPCSVHPGLCCPARYFHAILPATAARAPLEQISPKNSTFSGSKCLIRHLPTRRRLTLFLHFPLRPNSSRCLAPALSPTPEPCLLMKFLTFLQTLSGYQ